MLEILSLFVVVAVSSFLGLSVFYNNPRSATNKMFGLFAAAIIFWAVTMFLSLQTFNPYQTLFFIRLSMLAAILMSTAVLLLSHTIPSSTFTLSSRYLVPLLALAGLGMLTAMSPFMFTGIEIHGENIEPITGPGMVMFLITGLGYSISGIALLLRKYYHSKGLVRSQLRFVLIGITLMHVLLIMANFVIVLVFKSSYFISFGPLFTLTYLISAAYAITRHRLLEVRVLVARAVTFTLLSAVVVIVLAATLFASARLFPTQYQQAATILAGLFLAFSFNPLRKTLELITERLLHKHTYSSDDLLESLGDIVRSTLSIQVLTNKVVKQLDATIHPSKSAFLLFEKNKQKITLFDYGFKELESLDKDSLRLISRKARRSILVYEEVQSTSLRKIMRTHSISVAIPLRASNTFLGLFILGPKASGEVYSSQDLNVLEIFGPQISIAIQNSLAYDEIKRFNLTLSHKVKDATKNLRSANRELRHLDKLKDEFVYVATHELKTPVTVMRGYISMINDGQYGDLNDKLRDALKEIDLANQQLVKLVNDLLEIARNEVKSIHIETQPINLCQIVNDTVENIRPLAEQKELQMEYTCPKDHIAVKADPDRLKEILNNLLSNAIKYSVKGKISITQVIEKDFVITHVADQGVGISDEDQHKVFTRFFRAEEQAGKVPGTGLGSFIVKQLVEKMGGRIWFSSQLGKGTTFSFSLPKAG